MAAGSFASRLGQTRLETLIYTLKETTTWMQAALEYVLRALSGLVPDAK